MHISLILLPQIMSYSLLGPCDVLGVAAIMQPASQDRLIVQKVAAQPGPVSCFQGITLEPDALISDIHKTDLILVPSLILDNQHWFSHHQALLTWLQAQAQEGARLASTCTGAFLLAEAGLLDNKPATTHWAYAEAFRHRYPKVHLQPEQALVDNGQILTAGAGQAWQDLLLRALQGVFDDTLLLQIRQLFLMQIHDAGQKPYIGMPVISTDDALMQNMLIWIQNHHANDNTIELAWQQSGLNRRTFQRRFRQATGMSAIQYLQALRIEAAKTALLGSLRSVEEVGFDVGYSDSSFFRRLFRRQTGLSPREYRQRFSQQ